MLHNVGNGEDVILIISETWKNVTQITIAGVEDLSLSQREDDNEREMD